MSLLKPVTPEEAKRVWVSIPNPSSRRVAKALTQSGRRVHHSTIARWRAEDWRPVAQSLHPLEAARQVLDMAARVLTGDPVAGLKVLSDEGGRQQELEGLSDRELLRKASREVLIAIRLVSHVLPSQLPRLMATKITETATLLNAVNAGLGAAVDGLEQFHHLPEQACHATSPLGIMLDRLTEMSSASSSRIVNGEQSAVRKLR
jgi:hypothetical protein